MIIDILTLFPEMFTGPLTESLIGKARVKELVKINIHNIRDWATDKHKMADDRPFGGGPGMVLMIEPIDKALKAFLKLDDRSSMIVNEVRGSKLDSKSSNQTSNIKSHNLASSIKHPSSTRIILLDPAGKTFNQEKAEELSKVDHLILICGHYKGIDERIREHLVDEEISIGDYVLTGGEIPAMAVVDATVRLLPGVVGKEESLKKESFSDFDTPGIPRILGFPQYTRPETYKGWKVPEILLGGNHKEIEKWRLGKAKERTSERRPDLLK